MAFLKLLRSRIVWAVGLLIALFVRDKVRDSQAKKAERTEQTLRDVEDAKAIRDRVAESRDKRVQPDGLKYRD